AIMATDRRIGQPNIFDDGLQFAFIVLGDLAAKDRGKFYRADQWCDWHPRAGSKLIERCPATKDQIVTIFHLGKEKPVLATGSFTFALFEKWSQTGEPFLAATQKIVCSQRIGQLLKLLRLTASQECVGTLLKIDGFFAHPISQPVVLIQTDPR